MLVWQVRLRNQNEGKILPPQWHFIQKMHVCQEALHNLGEGASERNCPSHSSGRLKSALKQSENQCHLKGPM